MNIYKLFVGVMIVIVMIVGGIIAWSVMSYPLEYTVDALIDVYPSIPNAGVTTTEFETVETMLVWIFGFCIIFFIFMLFVWLFAFAGKEEYEK